MTYGVLWLIWTKRNLIKVEETWCEHYKRESESKVKWLSKRIWNKKYHQHLMTINTSTKLRFYYYYFHYGCVWLSYWWIGFWFVKTDGVRKGVGRKKGDFQHKLRKFPNFIISSVYLKTIMQNDQSRHSKIWAFTF